MALFYTDDCWIELRTTLLSHVGQQIDNQLTEARVLFERLGSNHRVLLWNVITNYKACIIRSFDAI